MLVIKWNLNTNFFWWILDVTIYVAKGLLNAISSCTKGTFLCMFDLYQSLNRLPVWNSQNCSMFPLAFDAGSLQGHWWGFISRKYVVWPIFFLMNIFIALKGTHFLFLFGMFVLVQHASTKTFRWMMCNSREVKLVFCYERNFFNQTYRIPKITSRLI